MSEIEILLRWLEIKKIYSSDFPNSLETLRINIDKSSLLERMLSGKDPLPIPPPKHYSYPWYSLIEIGSTTLSVHDFFFPETWQKKLFDYDFVMIAQNNWEILSCEDDKYTVTYHYQYLGQDRRVEEEWIFYKKFSDGDPNNEIWELKRL